MKMVKVIGIIAGAIAAVWGVLVMCDVYFLGGKFSIKASKKMTDTIMKEMDYDKYGLE